MPPSQPDVRPVSALTESRRDSIPPSQDKAVVSDENHQTSTHRAPPTETANVEPNSTPPAEIAFEPPEPKVDQGMQILIDASSDNPPPTPAPSKNTITTKACEPQMGDTRIVNGQKQSYFLGFGWVDDMGENEVIYCEGMYENGNKIGSMGGGTFVDGDGDINKMIGIMD